MTGERVDVWEALADCANELEAEIRARYVHADGVHPAMQHKFDRDMATVIEARHAMMTLRARVQAAEGEKAEETSVFGKYGNCPVQIERTVGDRQFYFRARGEHWSLCVGAAGDMSEFAAVHGEEILSGQINVPFIAGWMPAQLAEQLTDWGISAWTRQQSGEFERNTKELLDALDAARGVV